MHTHPTALVPVRHIRRNLAKDLWPRWLQDMDRSVQVELLYERPQGGYVVRVFGHTTITVPEITREYGQVEARHVDDLLPTGCYHCLERIAGRSQALCPSHGDEWEVG